MNDDKSILTESTLSQLQKWLINESLMPLRDISNGEVLGYYNSYDGNKSVVLSPAYLPDDMSKDLFVYPPDTNSVTTHTDAIPIISEIIRTLNKVDPVDYIKFLCSQFMLPSKPVISSKDVEPKCDEHIYSVDHVDVDTSSCSQSNNRIFNQVEHVYKQAKSTSQRIIAYVSLSKYALQIETMPFNELCTRNIYQIVQVQIKLKINF